MHWTGGKWEIEVSISHIRGFANGPRYDESMNDLERNNFRNLLLLCKAHHSLIDNLSTRDEYPPGVLLEWKLEREENILDDLGQLDWVDQESLQKLMEEAITETREEIVGALDRVTDVSKETLALLKNLVADSFVVPYLDAESVASLEYSASIFQGFSDYVPLLHESANNLRLLPDQSEMLHESARRLVNLPDDAMMLYSSARLLASLEGQASILDSAANKLLDLEPQINALRALTDLADAVRGVDQVSGVATSLNSASMSLSSAARTIDAMERASHNLAYAASKVPSVRRWSWREFWWGIAICAVFVVAVLALWAHATGQK